MKINLIMIGKTNIDYISEGIDDYEKRLKHYLKFEQKIITTPKKFVSLTKNELSKRESELILENLGKDSLTILLDENGKEMTSVEFSKFLETKMNTYSTINFVIGGAFGFSDSLKSKYQSIALSKMTFSHQMVRLIFIEQLYRAMTILKGQSYHH